jgi:hypothetical protein
VKQYATRLEEALNRLGNDGWQFVESHKEPWSGMIYFIFQRETVKEEAGEQNTGIAEVRFGVRK